ncbi:hypothetical protein Syun_027495 [Stephania yunnanensis]|uniref:Uncharacterized protein n=1 Tax=Stephania yunnanensis TaxID=152371 RepID=A0AAP0EG13_9MAGN
MSPVGVDSEAQRVVKWIDGEISDYFFYNASASTSAKKKKDPVSMMSPGDVDSEAERVVKRIDGWISDYLLYDDIY